MTTFAKVNNGLVEKVISAESSFFNTFVDSSPGTWIETSNMIRKNFAGIGYTYDDGRDAFIPPKPYPSWTLNESTGQWDPPIAQPAGNAEGATPNDTIWNEDTQAWDAA